MPWFPLLLAVHIALAVSLLLPSLLLPFLLRRSGDPSTVAHLLARLQGTGSLVIGLGLAVTGSGLLVILGPSLLGKPWLLIALAIYAANLVLAAVVSRPNLRRLARIDADGEPAAWDRRAKVQRRLAYLMALGTGLIGFLMSAKPEL